MVALAGLLAAGIGYREKQRTAAASRDVLKDGCPKGQIVEASGFLSGHPAFKCVVEIQPPRVDTMTMNPLPPKVHPK